MKTIYKRIAALTESTNDPESVLATAQALAIKIMGKSGDVYLMYDKNGWAVCFKGYGKHVESHGKTLDKAIASFQGDLRTASGEGPF